MNEEELKERYSESYDIKENEEILTIKDSIN